MSHGLPICASIHCLCSEVNSWRLSMDGQGLDANKRLLLVATLDALVDRGLIGFANDGSMLCAAV